MDNLGGSYLKEDAFICQREPGVGKVSQEACGEVTVLWGIPSTCCLKAVS